VLNRLFGVTLWCKTLVLRKDKVTQCLPRRDSSAVLK